MYMELYALHNIMESVKYLSENEEEMIPVDEAAKRYGITRDGVYYHVRRKALTTYRVLGDKRAYVKVADMEALRARPSAGKGVESPKLELAIA
jgi:hypothetical protein